MMIAYVIVLIIQPTFAILNIWSLDLLKASAHSVNM